MNASVTITHAGSRSSFNDGYDRFLRVNRGYWFLAGGLILGGLALAIRAVSLKFLFGWSAGAMGYVGSAYLASFTKLLFKSPMGVVPMPVKVLLLPYFLGAHGYNRIARRNDPSPAVQQVAEGIFLGRRLLSDDVPLLKDLGVGAVLDVTVEFDALELSLLPTPIDYLNVPVFDHSVPNLAQLHKAVLWIDDRRRESKKVVVHCALGRGRSATVVLAYLLFVNRSPGIRGHLEHLRAVRKTVAPNFRQLRLVDTYLRSELIKRSMRTLLIANPTAGGGKPAEFVPQLRDYLDPFMRLHVSETTPELDATTLAKQAVSRGFEMIIAAGGDGTVSQVANALIGTETVLGIIPAGTANALANSLYGAGIHLESLHTSCERILSGHIRRIDTARCNNRTMLLLAGLGFEQRMVERAAGEFKERWGALAYLVSGYREVQLGETFRVKMRVDDELLEFTTTSLVIANAAPPSSVFAQGGGEPVIDDGLLDITWLEPGKTPGETVSTIIDLFQAGLNDEAAGAGVNHRRAKSIEIETDPPRKVAVDGEVCEQGPLRVAVLPASLAVVGGEVEGPGGTKAK